MSSESIHTGTKAAGSVLAADKQKMGAALLVLLFGVFLIWGVAYANPITLHSAAHDVRHANGFPCH
tara:strand:+ start:98668 stop:98865 length:198 start_codon:yes stop_codon:yes gene_type:complete